jgi:hypothetical protein
MSGEWAVAVSDADFVMREVFETGALAFSLGFRDERGLVGDCDVE